MQHELEIIGGHHSFIPVKKYRFLSNPSSVRSHKNKTIWRYNQKQNRKDPLLDDSIVQIITTKINLSTLTKKRDLAGSLNEDMKAGKNTSDRCSQKQLTTVDSGRMNKTDNSQRSLLEWMPPQHVMRAKLNSSNILTRDRLPLSRGQSSYEVTSAAAA